MPNPTPTIVLLKTWLQAVNIDFLADGDDIIVSNAQGQPYSVRVATRDEAPSQPGELSIGSLTGRKLQEGLEAFNALQLALGYEPKLPVNRGPIPTKKIANGTEFELVAWRHSEFRRCPNPSPAKLASYKTVIEKAIWRFFRSNQILCQDNLLGVDDLRSYGTVWTVNYCGLYELERTGDNNHENERLLYTHLTQRFGDFRTILIAKSRNVLPKLDDAHIATTGQTYDYNDYRTWDASPGEEDEDDEAYIARHSRLDRSDPKRRRDSAAKLLEESLAALGHDEMVEALTAAGDNDRIHPDARAEAVKRLTAHQAGCSECPSPEELKQPPSLGADEGAGGVE